MKTKNGTSNGSPARLLESELVKLRRELRRTLRVYSARLEIQLAQTVAAVKAHGGGDELPRERIHELRDLTIMMRKRKTKPEKGRRKDLRQLDCIISDLHTLVPKE